MVAVGSIGAGGGSVAWVDARGCLRVGPRSAGAEPGPACYGRGGTEPAVTDALVALGLIDPQSFLGGRFVLDGERAVAALGRLGRAAGLDAEAAARGVHRLACEQMTLAVKALLVERGLDPRRFAFLCYGGCGPLFGASIARALGLARVVVPALSAVFSAFGAATAEVRRETTRTLFGPLPADPAEVAACFAALEDEVRAAMRAEGLADDRVTVARECDLRFHRQTWEVTVPLPTLRPEAVERLDEAFRTRYAALYGRGALAAGSAIDLVNCRAIAVGRVPRPALEPVPPGPVDARPAVRGARAAWLPGVETGRARVPVLDGERLRPGMSFAGPALVERRDTTILVPPGDRATVDGLGSLVVELSP
jgi:N-methylhydantoinase A